MVFVCGFTPYIKARGDKRRRVLYLQHTHEMYTLFFLPTIKIRNKNEKRKKQKGIKEAAKSRQSKNTYKSIVKKYTYVSSTGMTRENVANWIQELIHSIRKASEK